MQEAGLGHMLSVVDFSYSLSMVDSALMDYPSSQVPSSAVAIWIPMISNCFIWDACPSSLSHMRWCNSLHCTFPPSVRRSGHLCRNHATSWWRLSITESPVWDSPHWVVCFSAILCLKWSCKHVQIGMRPLWWHLRTKFCSQWIWEYPHLEIIYHMESLVSKSGLLDCCCLF